MLPGEILTATYLIDEPNFLSTISLIAEPETLWDSDIGIYENEYKQREIPVTIEYFTQDNELGFTVDAGARLGGLNIWTKPQKPFTIYLRGRFGDDYINYQVFENKQITNFSRIVFRNGGDDWEETPYWLDGAVPLAYQLNNERLKQKVKKYIKEMDY